MPGPSNDDLPSSLSDDAAFAVAEILEEYAPVNAGDYARLADEAEAGAATFEGGPGVAREVANELRRRGQALRDAGH